MDTPLKPGTRSARTGLDRTRAENRCLLKVAVTGIIRYRNRRCRNGVKSCVRIWEGKHRDG